MFTSSLLALALATLSSASPLLFWNTKAQVVRKCTVPNTAAITFDDGPYIYVQSVSDALTAAGAKGTFFFNGNNYGGCIYNEDQAKRVRYAFDAGHQIASHTWSHAHLANITSEQLNREFLLVDQAFERIAGVTPAFMRPPYGEYNDLVLEVAGAHGQTVALWDFDSRDSVGATADQSKALYDSLAKTHPSTVLALNHDVYQQTAQVVIPYAISVLKNAGYELVTLAECVGSAPYRTIGQPGIRDPSWTC